jgi:hypothetical protein
MLPSFVTITSLWDIFFCSALLVINLVICALYGFVWLRWASQKKYVFGIMSVTAALFAFHNAFFIVLQLFSTFRIRLFPGYVIRTLYVTHMVLGVVSLGGALLAPILLSRFILRGDAPQGA